ncbi:MAG: DUF393 domain-containing protein [Planctomycetales bacterium]|nr:DUF393 domain-containing protein [Planctomycetales bacterium]
MTSAPQDPPSLPRPAERPDADVVLYDGDCGICTRQVSRLPWWDCQQRLAYLSIHDPEVAERWPELDHQRLQREMCIVDSRGRRHWGPYAIRRLTVRLRRLWWATWLLYLPGAMWLAKPIYRWVAENRYRLSGGGCDSGACRVPPRR